jgi:hypothetical protein
MAFCISFMVQTKTVDGPLRRGQLTRRSAVAQVTAIERYSRGEICDVVNLPHALLVEHLLRESCDADGHVSETFFLPVRGHNDRVDLAVIAGASASCARADSLLDWSSLGLAVATSAKAIHFSSFRPTYRDRRSKKLTLSEPFVRS